MSEHTPLTEAKAIVDAISEDLIRMLSNAGWLDSYDARDAVIDIAPDLIAVLAAALAARTSTATADTGHKAGCQEFPTGWLCVSDCTTVWHDKATADTGPTPGSLEYAQMIAERHGDLDFETEEETR